MLILEAGTELKVKLCLVLMGSVSSPYSPGGSLGGDLHGPAVPAWCNPAVPCPELQKHPTGVLRLFPLLPVGESWKCCFSLCWAPALYSGLIGDSLRVSLRRWETPAAQPALQPRPPLSISATSNPALTQRILLGEMPSTAPWCVLEAPHQHCAMGQQTLLFTIDGWT